MSEDESLTPEKLSSKKLEVFFISLISFSFLTLLLYRAFVTQPIWFDEIFFKAIIFGGPLWLFAWKSGENPTFFGFERRRFWLGVFNGLAVGGIFGFIGLLSSTVEKGKVLIPYLFSSSNFWQTFGLAFVTAWWESLFFYGLCLSFLEKRLKNEWQSCAIATLIFLLFHAPVLVFRSGFVAASESLLLLAFFAFGQAILYLRTRSISSVVVSHAFWGMSLLVYGAN